MWIVRFRESLRFWMHIVPLWLILLKVCLFERLNQINNRNLIRHCLFRDILKQWKVKTFQSLVVQLIRLNIFWSKDLFKEFFRFLSGIMILQSLVDLSDLYLNLNNSFLTFLYYHTHSFSLNKIMDLKLNRITRWI